MKVTLVENQEALAAAVSQLKQSAHVGVDFEGESNQFRYGVHLCLVQIYDGSTCFVIDPQKVDDINVMAEVFENPQVEKIMFAADFDVRLIKHTTGMRLVNLFDLQLAAELLEFEKLSLTYLGETLIEKEIGLDKSMQRSNWNLRPLTEKQIHYAVEDVAHLLELSVAVKRKLSEKKLTDKCRLRNASREEVEMKVVGLSNALMRRAKKFSKTDKENLTRLFDLREGIAKEKDIPPYFVFSNDVLLKASKRLPKSEAEWKAMKGFPRKSYRYIKSLIDAVS